MKIVRLELRDGLCTGAYDFANLTVIISTKNQVGKTTLLRSVLYALGYQIPSTKGLKFDKVEFHLELETDDKHKLVLKRFRDTLEVDELQTQTIYSLPVDEDRLHRKIFGIQEAELLRNLIGVFYIDQDKGWTLLNRGRPIGSLHFQIEDFLMGLSHRSCDKEKEELATLEKEISKYKRIYDVAKAKVALTKAGDVIPTDTRVDDLRQQELLLLNRRVSIVRELSRLAKIIKENNAFKKYVASLRLRVMSPGGEVVDVTPETIIGFEDNENLLTAKRLDAQIELSKLDKEIGACQKELRKKDVLFEVESDYDGFAKELSRINVDDKAVERILSKLGERRKNLVEAVRTAISMKNEVVGRISQLAMQYCSELGLDDKYGRNIFTSDLKSLSGASYHLNVFAYRLAYLRMLREQTGAILPILIDSPNGREVEAERVDKMLGVLVRDFSNHQIIIATIRDPRLNGEEYIRMEDGVMHFTKADVQS